MTMTWRLSDCVMDETMKDLKVDAGDGPVAELFYFGNSFQFQFLFSSLKLFLIFMQF